MMDDYRRVMHPDDIEIVSDRNDYLKGKDAIEYLKKRKEVLLTVKEIINVGDKVKLKGFDDVLTVKLNDSNPFKYVGSIEDDNEHSFLFNQEDIEEIIFRSGRRWIMFLFPIHLIIM